MRFEFALISGFLLASTVVADPISLLPTSTNAGVQISLPTGIGDYVVVSENFTVPKISGPPGSGTTISLTMSDLPGLNALSIGVDLAINGNNQTVIRAWNHYTPNLPKYFDNITNISEGHELSFVILGIKKDDRDEIIIALVENLSTGGAASEEFGVGWPAFTTAGWFVGEISESEGVVAPLADFGLLTLGIGVNNSIKSYPPDEFNLTIVNIEREGKVLTNTSIVGDYVYIEYV